MSVRTMLMALAVAAIVALSAQAATDWAAVGKALGKTGSIQGGDVYRVGLVRSDLHLTLDGVAIKPVHVDGHGDAVKLATVIHAALAQTGTPMGASPPAPLAHERTLTLAGVSGRIDHLALDPVRKRLFVAELGNGTVEALDLTTGRSLGRIGGLNEPQGIGYLPGRDELAVATGGDGALRFYRAEDLHLLGSVKLGEDADNVRIDPRTGGVLVGYGRALAVVDPATQKVVRTISLPAHPEGFQLDGGRAYVNLPEGGGLAVVDLAQGRELVRWRNPGPHFNFPMALDPQGGRIAVAYRLPGKLVLFTTSGHVEQQLDICGDADDVFFDAPRRRLYVICGDGAVDVFEQGRSGYAAAGRLPTRRGARTGLFSPQLDRLYVAARSEGREPAAILAYRPL